MNTFFTWLVAIAIALAVASYESSLAYTLAAVLCLFVGAIAGVLAFLSYRAEKWDLVVAFAHGMMAFSAAFIFIKIPR